jgi:uncharacterized membrane protein YccC
MHLPDQRVLSDRVKTAIKTALAMVLAYGVALSMDWENAYWAAFAVAFCTLSTVGESLNKGLLRNATGILSAPARMLQGGTPLLFGLVLDRGRPLWRLLLSASLTGASFLAFFCCRRPSIGPRPLVGCVRQVIVAAWT